MMHITSAQKTSIVGDEGSSLVTEYAAALAHALTAATVCLRTTDAGGNDIDHDPFDDGPATAAVKR